MLPPLTRCEAEYNLAHEKAGTRRTPVSVLLFALFGIVTAFYVAEDVSPQAVHAENVEDLQESITVEGLAPTLP